MRALAHTIELDLRPLFCPNLAASSVCRGKWIFKENYLVCRYLLMPTSSTEVKALETTYCKLIYKRLSRWQRTGKKARREAPTWPLANWSIGQLRVLINSPNVPWVMCVLCFGKLQHHRTTNKNRTRRTTTVAAGADRMWHKAIALIEERNRLTNSCSMANMANCRTLNNCRWGNCSSSKPARFAALK